MTKSDPSTIAARVARTIAYMDSPRGVANWERNRYLLRMRHDHNVVAAIQTATGLITYEHIQEVGEALGPAINAKNAGKAA